MRSRIPADVERLMWLVAESNDPSAVTDFEQRFPDFRLELANRRRMVADLKGAKVPTASEHQIPRFNPRPSVPSAPARGIWVAGGLVLAALAVASYSVTKWVTTPVQKPTPPEIVRTDPIKPPNDIVYPPITQPQVVTPPKENPPVVVQEQPQPSRGDLPKSLKLSNTSLVAALKMIGANAGYNVDIAPGFEDETVSIDYDQVSTAEMLKDMGIRYNFTAFDQGDGTIIIVPAVDDRPGSGSTNGSQRHIGG